MTLFAAHSFLVLPIALALDALFGDPDRLWRSAPHPVVLMGRVIDGLDKMLNRGTSDLRGRLTGVLALIILIMLAGGFAAGLARLLTPPSWGTALEAIAVSTLLAQRSLYDHVRRVSAAFEMNGLPTARRAVSMIVGRDPNSLDQAGVCRAAIEATAENLSDGVVAPAFWYLVAGLPGIVIYKAVNTADSMIGHRTQQYESFGWAAARLDDALNFIAARLSGLLIIAAAFVTRADAHGAWIAMVRDAKLHRSPNAGWPEAAMAGALGLALAGPRVYASGPVEDAWMNDGGRAEAGPSDISRALRLFIAACGIHALVVAAIALVAV